MDYGFSTMPTMAARGAAGAAAHAGRLGRAGARSRAGPQPTVVGGEPRSSPAASGALSLTRRPLPRALDSAEISRNSASIAAAIAEVNSELATAGHPLAGDGGRGAAAAATGRRRATTAQRRRRDRAGLDLRGGGGGDAAAARDGGETVPDPTPNPRRGTTGGNEWGVQLGSYRAKGDAERQLLTTALMDVPELSGGLRRVEAARVQGVTVYRAQFVGLDQEAALAACASLARMQADCLPLAPGNSDCSERSRWTRASPAAARRHSSDSGIGGGSSPFSRRKRMRLARSAASFMPWTSPILVPGANPLGFARNALSSS